MQSIPETHRDSYLSSREPPAKWCHAWVEERCGVSMARFTLSCTSALDMPPLLLVDKRIGFQQSIEVTPVVISIVVMGSA